VSLCAKSCFGRVRACLGPYGPGRPAMSSGGRPRRGGNAGRWKSRLFSFSRDCRKSFPEHVLEMAKDQESGHFQMSKPISMKVSIVNVFAETSPFAPAVVSLYTGGVKRAVYREAATPRAVRRLVR